MDKFGVFHALTCFTFSYLELFLKKSLCFRFDLIWCACVVCRDFIDTLGNTCGCPIPS
jgi:hypothetical protein